MANGKRTVICIACNMLCFQFLNKKLPSMHRDSCMWGAGPLVCLVCLMHAELILFLSFRPQHDPGLLHGPWFLVLVTLALWSSALGPWLCPCMHCPWFPPALQGPWVLLLDSWSLALGPVSQSGRWGRKRATIYMH